MQVPVKGAGTPNMATVLPVKISDMVLALSAAKLEPSSSFVYQGRANWNVEDALVIKSVPVEMERAQVFVAAERSIVMRDDKKERINMMSR